MIEGKGNIILQLTKNPSSYLYEKIKSDINDKFNEIMREKNVPINNFIKNFQDISENLISNLFETNKILFNKEYQKLKDSYNEEFNKIFNPLKELITIYSSIEEKDPRKFLMNNFSQISEKEFKTLEELKSNLSEFKKYGIQDKKEDMACYVLPYDFISIKDKKYNLYYKDLILKTDDITHKGNIYLIAEKSDKIYANNFKIIDKSEDIIKLEDNNTKNIYNNSPHKKSFSLVNNYENNFYLNINFKPFNYNNPNNNHNNNPNLYNYNNPNNN